MCLEIAKSNILCSFFGSHLKTYPPTLKKSYMMFWAPITAPLPFCPNKIGFFVGGGGGAKFLSLMKTLHYWGT